MSFGWDSGNHMVHGTQTGKCFDRGQCEECGYDDPDGEEVDRCLGSGLEVYPSDCLACKESCCTGRESGFKCGCGHFTKEG